MKREAKDERAKEVLAAALELEGAARNYWEREKRGSPWNLPTDLNDMSRPDRTMFFVDRAIRKYREGLEGKITKDASGATERLINANAAFVAVAVREDEIRAMEATRALQQLSLHVFSGFADLDSELSKVFGPLGKEEAAGQ